ncbi:hypothetical protein [Actibacterium ureilyticum]|nr:hypothetical protein [Actibacterium ureilyticum]
MFWLARKILIPATAFGFGMWFQADQSAKACTQAGGTIENRICRGISP